MPTADDLRAFERRLESIWLAGLIHSPVHFCGGNEDQLVAIFQEIPRTGFVCSTWRSHFHALLHEVPADLILDAIMTGHSMNLNFPEYRFFSSAIVGGTLSIACGIASTGRPVWCFVGDMTASIGAFHDAQQYAEGHDLPVTFIIEDNGLATNTPTRETWEAKPNRRCRTLRYQYSRTYPHVGLAEKVVF